MLINKENVYKAKKICNFESDDIRLLYSSPYSSRKCKNLYIVIHMASKLAPKKGDKLKKGVEILKVIV